MRNNNIKNKKTFIVIRNGVIEELSEGFINLTGYSASELVGRSYLEVSHILKFSPEKEFQYINDKFNIYLFTKLLQPREVVGSVVRDKKENEIICFFLEKENSSLESKFPYVEQLYLDNNSGIAIYSSPDLVLLKANQKYINYLNEPFNNKESCIGLKFDQIVKGFKGSVAEEIWTTVMSTGKPFYASEVMFERYDRGITYWDSSIVPIYEDGKVKYIIDNSIEVTGRVINRKLVEKQTPIIEKQNSEIIQSKIIEEQKKQLEAIIGNMSDGLFTLDKDSKFTFLNDSAKEFFYNSDLVKKAGDTFQSVKYYDSEDNLIRLEDMPGCRVLNGEKIREYRITMDRPDGVYHFNISGSPIYDKSGNTIKAVLCTRNVTELVNSEKLIRIQKEQLEAVIENMSDGIYITDNHGKIIVMNAEAKSHLYQSDTIKFAGQYAINTKSFDMDGNEISMECLPLKRALKGEVVKDQTVLMKRPDKEIVLRINATPIYDINGDIAMALACTHDITDLVNKTKIISDKYKQLELLKEEADNANKVKSLFLANMSHEIRTPMNGILATIQLLQLTTKSIEQNKYIKMLKESSNILLTIINNILDISKIESGTFKLNNEPFSLIETIHSIYDNLLIIGNSKGLEISYYLDPTLDCRVIGDELRLTQILNNLITNAVKFTEEGYISFRITKISSENHYQNIKFTVKDTGIGIEESFKEKVFSIFNQGDISVSKYMGTGLGLSISKQLVTLMNGEIRFESVVGQGSTFCFTCKLKKSS